MDVNDLWLPGDEYDDEFNDEYAYEDEDLESEFRFVEIDAKESNGRTVVGTALDYNTPDRHEREMFESGVFGNVSELDVKLNIQHDRRRMIARTGGGGLELSDSPNRLQVAATLPEIRDADDALTMIEKRMLRGFSVEFRAKQERYIRATRSIRSALLSGIGLVDIPAYGNSIITEVRQAGEEGISGTFPYNSDTITAATGKVRKQRIAPGAFSYAVKAPDREINLFLDDNSKPLASKVAGSLILQETKEGLNFRVKKLPRTSYVADFLSMLRSRTVKPGIVPFFSATPRSVARRLFSNGRATELQEEEGNPGIFSRLIKSALLTGLSILFRPPRGNSGTLTRLPRRFGRPGVGVSNTLDSVLPRQGDIVRGGRVIRGGIDVGPLRRRYWTM